MPKSAVNDLNGMIGELVRNLRKERDLTLQELAGRLEISHQQLQKYEKGTNQISAVRLKQIVQILEAPPAYFARLFEYETEAKKAPKGFDEEAATYVHAGSRALEAEELAKTFARLIEPSHRKVVMVSAKTLADFERKKAG